MERDTQIELNSSVNREALISVFPNLRNDASFKILSPQTQVYNCIAWAMNFNDRWVDIAEIPGHWWPNGVVKSLSPDALVQAFEAVGFETTTDKIPEEGFDKVVLYKKINKEEWTHASRIITESVGHSKFGAEWDGSHSIDSISGTVYGTPYCWMKRSQSYHFQPEIRQSRIEVNIELLRKFLQK